VEVADDDRGRRQLGHVVRQVPAGLVAGVRNRPVEVQARTGHKYMYMQMAELVLLRGSEASHPPQEQKIICSNRGRKGFRDFYTAMLVFEAWVLSLLCVGS
jgi:hypothetical protein